MCQMFHYLTMYIYIKYYVNQKVLENLVFFNFIYIKTAL